jgi:hypothetical protein
MDEQEMYLGRLIVSNSELPARLIQSKKIMMPAAVISQEFLIHITALCPPYFLPIPSVPLPIATGLLFRPCASTALPKAWPMIGI